jgi:amino acid permease
MVNSLEDSSRTNALGAVKWAINITNIIYISIAFLGVFFFGSAIEESILNNISLQGDDWESYILRVIFLMVLACHIPFIFWSGKESVLIIIDEYNRKSISNALM